ncbi:MAG: sigma-70 family RNA polymerase sigma factor [Pirellulales bacterium]|nr:sigma-70 family RNA polymerase sigma factor [Pirellulales bacterium]
MSERHLSESFVRALLDCQDALRAYVTALICDPYAADDVVQQTNVVLCRQADEFPTIKNFTAWACRIAYFEVLSFRKRSSRDRLTFDDELLALVARDVGRLVDEVTPRKRFLDLCLTELPENQRNMILKRYGRRGALKALADELGRPLASVQQTLYRIRLKLLECVRRKMEGEP